ncbi:hypothetical protein CSA37_09290 [Candidatus Fermentibacteria bacterium]|nr:MAG: hypothetical protein CSA37_09290 [Candidatus Fermentibacteria bacterium]
MSALLFLLMLVSVPDGVTEFDLSNGIHVITRTVPGGEVEGFSMFLIGGSRMLSAETRGIEAFAVQAAMTGSENYPPAEWRELMDITLAEWSSSYNYDLSRYHLKCLSEDLPVLLEGFADCLLSPRMEPSEVARVRESLVNEAVTELEDPDNRIWLVANQGFMGEGHPYLLRPEGVPETLSRFTAEDASAWLSERIVSGNIVLAHAGPANPEALREILESSFGRVPEGSQEIPEVPEFQWPGDTLILENDEILTAYCLVKFNAPPAGHRDQTAFSTACMVIDELLWQVLRTENAITYATNSGYSSNYCRNWGYMYASTPEPALASELMTDVFQLALSGDIDQAMVTGVAKNSETIQGIHGQTMENQTWLLGSGYISTGDWRTPYLAREALTNVTAEEASAALERWAGSASWGIIGDSTLVDFSQLAPLPLKGE